MLGGLEQVGLVVNVGDLVAGALTTSFPILKLQNRNIDIVSTKVAVRSDVTSNSTNYVNVALMNAGDCVAYLDTSAIGLTASVFRELTLVDAKSECEEDDTLTLRVQNVESGVGLCGLTVQLEYEIVK
ncbi:MAG: hypothetical protein ACTSR2_06230 [Candidatus Hodarchaeales archaeon]